MRLLGLLFAVLLAGVALGLWITGDSEYVCGCIDETDEAGA